MRSAAPDSQRAGERQGSAPSRGASVAMRYLGDTALLLKGPVSRRVYALRPGTMVLDVDTRDAATFSTSPLFQEISAM